MEGRTVGRYRLLAKIGDGAYAQVFAARDPEGQRPVRALKIIPIPSDLEPEAALLLADEAQLALNLRHPRLIRSHEFGEDQGLFFIAMDLVRGPSLLALLQRLAESSERLPVESVVHIGRSVAEALHYLHSVATQEGRPMRVVHRDVSPQNILLDHDGGVRLADFGTARFNFQRHSTLGAMLIGKPGYLAPEQVRGEAADPRADLFALGVVLWEATTGRRLFPPPNALEAVLGTRAPRLDGIRAESGALSHVVARALEPEADARFQTSLQMLSELAELNRELPEGAGPLAALVEHHFPREAFDAALDSVQPPDASTPSGWPTVEVRGTEARFDATVRERISDGFQTPTPLDVSPPSDATLRSPRFHEPSESGPILMPAPGFGSDAAPTTKAIRPRLELRTDSQIPPTPDLEPIEILPVDPKEPTRFTVDTWTAGVYLFLGVLLGAALASLLLLGLRGV